MGNLFSLLTPSHSAVLLYAWNSFLSHAREHYFAVMSSYLHLRLKEKHIYLCFSSHKIMLGMAPCRKMSFLPYCFRAFCIIHPSCKQYSQKFSQWISAGWVDLGKTF